MSLKTVLKILGYLAVLVSVFTAAATVAYKLTAFLKRKPLAVIESDGEDTKISA
ncbi:MAG: hypothetical protein KBS41_02790 [Oscillospiraceae bacterium]|nr:hypothetical protein [Candidatus Equicaccousia limihippi]